MTAIAYKARMQDRAGLGPLAAVCSLVLTGVLASGVSALAQTSVPQKAAAAQKASETNLPAAAPAKGGTTAEGSMGKSAAPTPAAPTLPKVQGEMLDQIVAIVNGQLVLDSDVDEERRFEQFQPYLAPTGGYTRDRAIERVINRDLMLQQAELQPGEAIADADVTKQTDELRKQIPACQQFHCETEAGWKRYLAERGFTVEMLNLRWKERMQVLAFIEERFRSGINITPAEIKTYYVKTFLPEYARQGTPPPPSLEKVSPRIQEILLQQQVSALLGDWLRSLRAQGGVVVLHPGEEAP